MIDNNPEVEPTAVLLGIPGDEKVSEVPGATVPVLVTVRVWVATQAIRTAASVLR